jgi:hypothetical protein
MHALTVGSSAGAFFAFAVAGLVIVLLLVAVSVGLAVMRESAVTALRGQGPRMKRWAGGVLLALGLWFIALAVWADFFARVFPV